MNEKRIETLSIDAVRDSIVASDYLDQFIQDNDKEPSWDGFIYIYNNKRKRKRDLIGRVPAQIKGKETNDFSNEEISYPIKTNDLNNYLNDGGAIFFVVYVNGTDLRKKIYYIELPIIRIRMLLREAKGQQTISVNLKIFPEDSNRKRMILINCWENCQKQSSFCNATLLSIEELEKAGVLEGLTIPVTTIEGINPETALLFNDVFLYAKIKGCSIPQPIEAIPVELFTQKELPAFITIDDKLFYNSVKQIRRADSVTTIIGDSLSIITNTKNKDLTVTFKQTNSLRSLAIDLEFIIAFVENGYFQYNGIKIPFNETDADLSKFNINNEKQYLQLLKNTVKTLDILGCKKDVEINTLTHMDWNNINYLIKAFVDKSTVSGLKNDLSVLQGVRFGNLSFILCFEHVENQPGTYRIYDYFNKDLILIYESNDGVKLPTSQFDILSSKELLIADNIRYDILLKSFKRINKHPELADRANTFLLRLLLAYDKDSSKTELLKVAFDFANWLMDVTDEEMPYNLRLLNLIQVEKRMGDINLTRKKELFKIIETPNLTEIEYVGAYLLLGQQDAAEVHFKKMNENQQEMFKQFPIYHFWNNNIGNQNG